MKYALVNNKRSEAEPKLEGLCPYCNQKVIAKCGSKKIWHWAHTSINECDPWWENETEWHINWKNKFPQECQEIIFTDKLTNEKHIADVHLKNGLTIEFQHSAININERISREKFYNDMIWIVDGTRRKKDFKNFIKGHFTLISQQFLLNIYKFNAFDNIFPEDWSNCNVPVIFDFLGIPKDQELIDSRKIPLYCILPQKIDNVSCMFETTRETIIQNAINGGLQNFLKRQMNILNQR